MSRIYPILAAGIAIAIAPACNDLTAPLPADRFELPPADTSLDPGRLAVGDYLATPCAFGSYGDGLAQLRALHDWALVDIFFGRGSPAGPWDGPTSADIALVKAHGGRVLYSFNVPAVRARIILSRIPDLVQAGFWITVRDVPDATRFDVILAAGFTRALENADVARFVSLGGRVDHRLDFIDALAGVLPDRSIPHLRQRDEVEYIEPESVFCLQ